MKKFLIGLSLVSAFATAHATEVGPDDVMIDRNGTPQLGADVGKTTAKYDPVNSRLVFSARTQGQPGRFWMSCAEVKEAAELLKDQDLPSIKEEKIIPLVEVLEVDFKISTDPAKIDNDTIERFQKAAYGAVVQRMTLAVQDIILRKAPSCQ